MSKLTGSVAETALDSPGNLPLRINCMYCLFRILYFVKHVLLGGV